MKTRLILICLVAAVLFHLFACSSAPKELSLNIDNSGKEFTLANGGTLTITLLGYTGDNHLWGDAKVSDDTVITQIDYKTLKKTTLALGLDEVWTFKALKAGKSTILIEYLFIPNSRVDQKFTVNIIVK